MPCSLWYCSLNAPIPRKSGCSSPLVAVEWESPCGEVEQQAVRSRFPALGVRRLPTAGLSSDSVNLLVLLPFIPSIEHIFKCFRFFDLGAQEPRGEDLLVLVSGRRKARHIRRQATRKHGPVRPTLAVDSVSLFSLPAFRIRSIPTGSRQLTPGAKPHRKRESIGV